MTALAQKYIFLRKYEFFNSFKTYVTTNSVSDLQNITFEHLGMALFTYPNTLWVYGKFLLIKYFDLMDYRYVVCGRLALVRGK